MLLCKEPVRNRLFGNCTYLTRKQEEDDVDAIKENSHAETKIENMDRTITW